MNTNTWGKFSGDRLSMWVRYAVSEVCEYMGEV